MIFGDLTLWYLVTYLGIFHDQTWVFIMTCHEFSRHVTNYLREVEPFHSSNKHLTARFLLPALAVGVIEMVPSICLSVSLKALSQLNRWVYQYNFWCGDVWNWSHSCVLLLLDRSGTCMREVQQHFSTCTSFFLNTQRRTVKPLIVCLYSHPGLTDTHLASNLGQKQDV